jgi:hypothetical protein
MIVRTCFVPYVFDGPDAAGNGLQGVMVRGNDLEFKQASTALMMTFA